MMDDGWWGTLPPLYEGGVGDGEMGKSQGMIRISNIQHYELLVLYRINITYV